MDLYQDTLDLLLALTPLQDWPEARTLLAEAAARRDRHWYLAVLACEAAGGSAAQVVPLMAAIACQQTGIVLVDDMLDADPRGYHHAWTAGGAANMALALHAASTLAIAQSAATTPARLAALGCLGQMGLEVALGQHFDTHSLGQEADYWRTVALKSGAFFGAIFEAGAIYGGAAPELAGQLYSFGKLYGEMIQLHDDLHDTLAVPASPDWLEGRAPLPILFALNIAHPDQARFQSLRPHVQAADALAEAQQILLRCGAVSYCVLHMIRRDQAARALLAQLPLASPEGLRLALDEQMAPVRRLLRTAVAGRRKAL